MTPKGMMHMCIKCSAELFWPRDMKYVFENALPRL